jgi:50S ribosomal subunit-associated GTPase HflX
MIIDPHSSLWESDLILVVHDVSNPYSRDKLDSEVIKCLFSHPDKETILVLNKTDRLTNKTQLLDLVASLTGGRLNGKEFMARKRVDRSRYTRNSLRDDEYEDLFARTADKMKIHLPDTKKGKKHEKILELLEELKTCEEFLIKNQERISFKEHKDDELSLAEYEEDPNQLVTLSKILSQFDFMSFPQI